MKSKLNTDTIKDLYINQNKKFTEVVSILNTTNKRLRLFLTKNNILKCNKGTRIPIPPKEDIEKMYNLKSIEEMSDYYNVSKDTIQNWCMKYSLRKVVDPDALPSVLTKRQIEILIGALLGDGYMKITTGSNSEFSINQSKFPSNRPERTEFIDWIYNEMLPFSRNKYEKITKGGVLNGRNIKPIIAITFSSYCHSIFTTIRKEWYIEGKPIAKKVVPDNFKLTPLMVAVWAMGDGVNCPKSRRFAFCTNSFSLIEREMLVRKFKNDLGIDAYTVNDSEKRIYIRSSSYIKFINIISCHVLKCFSYKCSLKEYTIPVPRRMRKYGKGYKGVAKNGNRYTARISVKENRITLGRFDCPEDAAKCYDWAATKVYGKGQCYLNFPEIDYNKYQPNDKAVGLFNDNIRILL